MNHNNLELLPLSDPRVHRALGVEQCQDPYQAAARIIRAGHAPASRIGRRIRVSLPSLAAWAAEKLNPQSASAAAQ